MHKNGGGMWPQYGAGDRADGAAGAFAQARGGQKVPEKPTIHRRDFGR